MTMSCADSVSMNNQSSSIALSTTRAACIGGAIGLGVAPCAHYLIQKYNYNPFFHCLKKFRYKPMSLKTLGKIGAIAAGVASLYHLSQKAEKALLKKYDHSIIKVATVAAFIGASTGIFTGTVKNYIAQRRKFESNHFTRLLFNFKFKPNMKFIAKAVALGAIFKAISVVAAKCMAKRKQGQNIPV